MASLTPQHTFAAKVEIGEKQENTNCAKPSKFPNPDFGILLGEWGHIELKSWLDRTSGTFGLFGGPLRPVVGATFGLLWTCAFNASKNSPIYSNIHKCCVSCDLRAILTKSEIQLIACDIIVCEGIFITEYVELQDQCNSPYFVLKQSKNCECCPVSQLIVR